MYVSSSGPSEQISNGAFPSVKASAVGPKHSFVRSFVTDQGEFNLLSEYHHHQFFDVTIWQNDAMWIFLHCDVVCLVAAMSQRLFWMDGYISFSLFHFIYFIVGFFLIKKIDVQPSEGFHHLPLSLSFSFSLFTYYSASSIRPDRVCPPGPVAIISFL